MRAAGPRGAGLRAAAPSVGGLQLGDEAGGSGPRGGRRGGVPLGIVGRVGEREREKRVMDRLKESVENGDASLLQNEAVNEILVKKQASWRRVAALAVIGGVSAPVATASLAYFDIGGVSAPVATASLAYFDTMRRDKLPQNYVVVGEKERDEGQAMRDLLEASSFERTDCARGMTYHCEWTKETNWLVC